MQGLLQTGAIWSVGGLVIALVWTTTKWSERRNRRLWVLLIVLNALLAVPVAILLLSALWPA